MDGFPRIAHAARQAIRERIALVEENAFGDYTPEDLDAMRREAAAIEIEIAIIGCILDAAMAIAKMRHPSIEKILRRQGFDYEADKIAELVRFVDEGIAFGAI